MSHGGRCREVTDNEIETTIRERGLQAVTSCLEANAGGHGFASGSFDPCGKGCRSD
jgi:hypothetical protein